MGQQNNLPRLNNTYWLLRHGRSLANEAGLIVCHKVNGVLPEWKLAEAGRQQAIAAGTQLAAQLAAEHVAPAALLVVTSPFSRTVETAQLAAAQVGVLPDQEGCWIVDDALRERDFGSDNELQPCQGRYESTWEQDACDMHYRPGGDGESVRMVSDRLLALFQRIESGHQGRHVLLVSHGDTLSICQAMLSPGRDNLKKHRDCAFETAQLKRLN